MNMICKSSNIEKFGSRCLVLTIVLLLPLFLGCCSSRIKAPAAADSNLAGGQTPKSGANASNAGPGEKFDPAVDELICKQSLKAWRLALSHDDFQGSEKELAELKKKDEAESMTMLQDLSRRFPTQSFIKTMMGQVKQHFGKKEEAAALYEEASLLNRRDPILIFKAAEMRRGSGNMAKAKTYYEEVLLLQPDFPGAKVGLARCLMLEEGGADKARKILAEHSAKNPEDADAKAALKELEKSQAAGSSKEPKEKSQAGSPNKKLK